MCSQIHPPSSSAPAMSFSKLSETPIGPIDCPPWAGTVHLATPIPNAVADAQRMFVPPTPSSTPAELFSVQVNECTLRGYRFVRNTDREQMLMFVDGSSLAQASASYSRPSSGTNLSPIVSNKTGMRRRTIALNYARCWLRLACGGGTAKDSRRLL